MSEDRSRNRVATLVGEWTAEANSYQLEATEGRTVFLFPGR
jgi:hypothetical protein